MYTHLPSIPSSCGAAKYATYPYFIDGKFRGKAARRPTVGGQWAGLDLDGKNTQGQVGNKRKTFIVLCQQKFTKGK